MTTTEGAKIDSLTTSYVFSQVISDPTHILPNPSLCIDLLFINQYYLVTASGVHPSLHPNCHHQIVFFVKLNLKIQYLSLYECLIWDYKNANEQLINRKIENLNLDKSFEGDQVNLVNKIIFNIFHNFITNKIIICSDKDPL